MTNHLAFNFLSYRRTPEQTRSAIALLVGLAIGALLMLLPFETFAQAVAGPAPWEDGLCRIAKSISGPIPKYAAVICVAVMGMLMAFGELGGIFKTMAVVVIGISMAIGAIAWIPWLTGNAVALSC